MTLSCVYRELSPCSPAWTMTFASDSPCRITYRSSGMLIICSPFVIGYVVLFSVVSYLTCVMVFPLTMNACRAMSIIG